MSTELALSINASIRKDLTDTEHLRQNMELIDALLDEMLEKQRA